MSTDKRKNRINNYLSDANVADKSDCAQMGAFQASLIVYQNGKHTAVVVAHQK